MKILKRNRISVQEAEKLIEKYYEGETLVEEEALLREFLSGKDVPEQFEAEKAIFGYFENQKPKQSAYYIPRYMRWIASAAVVVLFVSGFMLSRRLTADNYAYVDGKKITDEKVILSLALTTVNNLTSDNAEFEAGLDNIRGNDMIENQLDAFSDIKF